MPEKVGGGDKQFLTFFLLFSIFVLIESSQQAIHRWLRGWLYGNGCCCWEEVGGQESHVSTTAHILVSLKLWAAVCYILQPAQQII